MGLVTTLTWRGVTIENGYVEPCNAVGGPELGTWCVYLGYYASLEQRQAGTQNKLSVDDATLNQIVVPYVAGNDPINDAMTVLQTWFPSGVVQ